MNRGTKVVCLLIAIAVVASAAGYFYWVYYAVLAAGGALGLVFYTGLAVLGCMEAAKQLKLTSEQKKWLIAVLVAFALVYLTTMLAGVRGIYLAVSGQ